jgi:predicted DNA-binding transcriptional regulator AlpA
LLGFFLNSSNLKGDFMNSNKLLPLKPKIYFKKHLQQITNLNIQTIRRMWARGEFPKPTLINGRCAWRSDVIHQWIADNLGETNHG